MGIDVFVDALRLYRQEFVPAHPGDRPHAILGLTVIVGEDDEHAEALALPWHLTLVQNRADTSSPLMSVEDAQRHHWSTAERDAEAKVDRRADVVGGPERVRAQIAAFVQASEADEVIASSNLFDPEERRASYTRFAAAVRLPSRPQPDPWRLVML